MTPTDILTIDEHYEIHPATDRNGRETGWYAVVSVTTGEVLATHSTREAAIVDARARARR